MSFGKNYEVPRPMYKAKLSIVVCQEDDPSIWSSAQMSLDRPFTVEEIPLVGTALQAGSWELLQAVMREVEMERIRKATVSTLTTLSSPSTNTE